MRTERIRSVERKSKAKRAKIFKAIGLTSRGTEYKRSPNFTAAERPERQREYNLLKYHRRARRNFKLALTSRGKNRKYFITLGAADAAILETEIKELVGSLALLFHSLPPTAQAQAVKLSHGLSSLRTRIQLVKWK
jgi:hypothetical protein